MPNPTSDQAKILRQRFGALIRGKREESGLTQSDLALALDWRVTGLVSQVERGVSAPPPATIAAWSAAIGMTAEEFARAWLWYCEPYVYAALFGVSPFTQEHLKPPAPTVASLKQAQARVRKNITERKKD
ncbi:helix-turn-helix transcriptional regulator [Variovorax humicola]|uniref:Helix-turn-helix transcriptional regulator n=1 Tax=Variovorax humicola TaxID=1769758 RepID=A0ABU8VX76_9BURK